MKAQQTPKSYVVGEYISYQKRYKLSPRDSDRVLLEIIGELSANCARELKLLDVGCHTGNFLYHVTRMFSHINCTGIDIFPELIDYCTSQEHLSQCKFYIGDIRNIQLQEKYDIVVCSAVLSRFNDEEITDAFHSLYKILANDGHIVVFDWVIMWNQSLYIIEKSKHNSDGLIINMRSIYKYKELLTQSGFVHSDFRPFRITIDLPRPDDMASMNTYTVDTPEGERLNFRGALFQPWCHFVARK